MISNRMIIKGKVVIVEDGQQLTPGYVVIEGDNISEVYSSLPDSLFSEEIIEADIVSPGFVDIHTHGLGGANEQLEYWLHDYSFKKLPSYGCTSVLASITFPEDLSTSKKVIEILKKRVGQVIEGQTVLEGLHAEGPVVIDCGGLPHAHGETMEITEFQNLLTLMGPALKIMTIAPSAEAKFQYSRLKALLDHGAVPALGHDKEAVEKDIIGALRVCASHTPPVVPHMTHMCNVSSFHHRIPSLVNFGMVDHYPNEEQYKGIPVPTIEMIGDLVHVSALTLKAVLGNRSPNHLAFVTDSVLDSDASSSLCSDNKMAIKEVYMGRKAVVMEGTDTIAGSCGNMIQILQSLVNVLQVPVEKAVQMLSETPATIARINSHVGTLSAGKRADILLLDSNLKLMSTIIAGKVVYKQQVVPN